MSRSYHITRKQADKAIDSGDLEPTWQASEKAWVKKKESETRVLGKTLKDPTKISNRVITAGEKARTSRAKEISKAPAMLDSMLVKKRESNPESGRHAKP